MTYLIVLADILTYQPVSVNLDPDTLNAYILDAQLTGLQDVVGAELYERIIAESETPPLSTPIAALAQWYVPYLCFKTVEGLYRLSSTKVTRTGVARKTTTVSEPVEVSEEIRMADEMRSRCGIYARNMLNYIQRNLGDFPEWNINPDGLPQGQITNIGFTFVGQGPNVYS